jgi:hypothetical protein
MIARRYGIVAFALIACRGSHPTTTTTPLPPDHPATATCDDAVAHAAELIAAEVPDQPIDAAALKEKCVEEAWSAEVNACVVASATAAAAAACFSEMLAATPLCTALARIVEARTDGAFASIRLPSDDGDEDADEYESSVSLPDAPCFVEATEYPVVVTCHMYGNTDVDKAGRAYLEIADAVDNCLKAAGWTGAGDTNEAAWTQPGAEEPAVRVTASQVEAGYSVDVHVDAVLPEE